MLLCGFEKFNDLFVRIDILERLFLIIFKSDSDSKREIKVTPEMLNLLGCTKQNFIKLLKQMNYKIYERDKDFYLKIGSVSLPKILYVLSSAGNPYAKNSEFKINKLVGNAKPENIDAMPAHMVLAALGQEAFEFDFRVKANVDDRGLAFEMNTLVELSMKGGFGFDLNFKYNVPAELIVKLEGYAKQGYFNQESLQDDAAMHALGLNMLSELGSIQLSKIEILLQDKGLRKPLLLMLSSNLGMNEEETIQMAINALYSSLQAIIPQNIEKVEKSISEFLINGGKLKLTISPPNPVPIMAAGGLLMMPDLAIESLGVSLNHIP